MPHFNTTISASNLTAQLAQIDAAFGTVVAVLEHPYMTDGDGPMLIVVWRQP